MVSVKDGFIETDLYTKPTDKTPVSSHFILLPHNTKRSIRYSLALRLRRICSGHDSYIQRTNKLINYLNNRGHDKAFLTRQIQRTSDVLCADALKDKPPTRTETTPFVITYNLTLPNVAHIIHKHSHVLYSSERCRNVFKNLLIVSYCHSNNLSDILVRVQLPETDNCNNARATPGSFRCNSRNCTTCPYIDHGRDNYKIKSHITCNTFNVIHMIQCRLLICNILGKLNAASRTVLMNINAIYLTLRESYIQTAVSEHFRFSAIATLFHICYLSQSKHLDMNAIVLGKHVRGTSFIKPKQEPLWLLAKTIEPLPGNGTNVTNYNHYVIFIFFFDLFFVAATPYNVIPCNFRLLFYSSIYFVGLWFFVINLMKTGIGQSKYCISQPFSRCLISL